jgi:hyperosmotically inducible periplasmic protein
MKLKNIFSGILLMGALTLFVTSCKPKDADVQAKIVEALKATPGFSVAVKDGVATLTGVVENDAAKAAAEAAIKGIKGVASVVNNVTVTPPIVFSADEVLGNGAKAALAAFGTVSSMVKDGIITLTGSLKRDDLAKVMSAVQALKPVKVVNQITITK